MKGKVLVVLLPVFLLVAWSVSAEDLSLSAAKESFKKGSVIYSNHCAECHGNLGEGSSGPQINNISQKKFIKGVKKGMGGSFSYIPTKNIKKVFSYLKKINKAAKMISAEKENYSATLDGIFDSSCASCHAESFRGKAKATLDAKIKKALSK